MLDWLLHLFSGLPLWGAVVFAIVWVQLAYLVGKPILRRLFPDGV